MNKPFKIDQFINETIKLLDPYINLSNVLKLNHNSIQLNDQKLEIKGKLYLFGAGKAASYEVDALYKILEKNNLLDKLGFAIAYTKHDHTVDNENLIQLEGSHPVVSLNNIEMTKKFITHLEKVTEDDTIIFLLSGGASALLELPNDGISFSQLQKKHEEMLLSGMSINKMNAARKEMSQVKNGKLLNFIKTKNILQLITCDIPNETLEDVSSGPLLSSISKEDHPLTIKTQSASLLLNRICESPNFIKGDIFDGEFSDLIKYIKSNLPTKNNFFVSGGEAPIIVNNSNGKGGRNTHFVLALANELYKNPEYRDINILSFGTDGGDGPTDAAGAYINYEIFSQNPVDEYLSNFNSYEYFKKTKSLIITGPTRTNVMDLRCIWRE